MKFLFIFYISFLFFLDCSSSQEGSSSSPGIPPEVSDETLRAAAIQQALRRVAQPNRGTPAQIVSQLQPERANIFDKVFEDVRCVGEKLTSRPAKDLKECKQRCTVHEQCNFFAYWTTRKLCETYHHCYYRSSESEKIVVYKKLTICEEEISRGGLGYIERIKAAFPKGFIRPMGTENPNFVCRCTGTSWMTCGIFVRPGTPEETIATQKLNLANPAGMKPFYEFDFGDGSTSRICMDEKDGMGFPRVIAEVRVVPSDQCVPLKQCLSGTPNGICPVRRIPFESRDPVYFVTQDLPNLLAGNPITCVTASGLQTMYQQAEEPLREGRDQQYLMIWAFNEEDIATGICQPKKKRRGGKKKKKEGVSESGSSEPGTSSAQQSSSGRIAASHSDSDLQGLESSGAKASDASTLTRALISPVQPVPTHLSPQSSGEQSPPASPVPKDPEMSRLAGNNPFSMLDDGFAQSKSRMSDAENVPEETTTIAPSKSPVKSPIALDPPPLQASPTSLVPLARFRF